MGCAFLAAGVEAGSVRFVRAAAPNNGDGLTWATAYNKLFTALDDAADGGVSEIWVASGTYSPRRSGSNRDQTFSLVSGVALLGGFAGNEASSAQRNPGANLTILSGDFNGNDAPNFAGRGDNARHIVQGVDAVDVTIDGFTLRGGNADFPGDDLLGGGALHLHRCIATVANCIFSDNIAGGTAPDLGGFGGGLFVQGGNVRVLDSTFQANRGMNGGALGIWGSEQDRTTIDAIVTIEGCDFISNFSPSQTGGAIWSNTGDPLNPQLDITGEIRVRGCRFLNNRGEYYGAWTDYNTPVLQIEDSEFSGNSSLVAGGALAIGQTVGIASTARLRGCLFSGNQNPDSGGSALFVQARPVLMEACIVRDNIGPSALRFGPVLGFSGGAKEFELRNSLIEGNSGTGVFGFRNPSATVTNCTISGNQSGISGGLAGGIETSAASVTVANTILWGNSRGGVMDEPAQIRVFDTQPDVNFNIVQGLTGALGGVGNLGADPLFVDAAGGNFALGAGSPAIDAGSNPDSPLDLLDLDGDGDTAERTPTDLLGQSRFQDDPASADSGVGGGGQASVIDIGAIEFAACAGDLDGDGIVALGDLAILLGNFGAPGGAGDGDLNGDGTIDLTDLSTFLSRFGTSC